MKFYAQIKSVLKVGFYKLLFLAGQILFECLDSSKTSSGIDHCFILLYFEYSRFKLKLVASYFDIKFNTKSYITILCNQMINTYVLLKHMKSLVVKWHEIYQVISSYIKKYIKHVFENKLITLENQYTQWRLF